MRRARHIVPLRPLDWAKQFRNEIANSPEAQGSVEKAGKADLVALVEYLLYEWSMTGSRWLPGLTEALQKAKDLRRAARRAVHEAEKHRTKSGAAMSPEREVKAMRRAEIFRRRELDALLRSYSSVHSLPKAESLEESLRQALRLPAPTPRPVSRNFFLVTLYEAASSQNAKLTWVEVATLAQIASRAAGCERSPDERELRRYASRPGVRGLARRWLATFPPVVAAFWPR